MMQLSQPGSEVFVPDGITPVGNALARTTHLGIGAHQDDLAIMALHGILECYMPDDQWFTGVTATNGSGSPREGEYAGYSGEQMMAARRQEDKMAAMVGRFSALALLDFPSSALKTPDDPLHDMVVPDLIELIRGCRPQFIYTHNLADKHDTHVAVALRVVRALRELGDEFRPKEIWGCEVWRGLDWLWDDEEPVEFYFGDKVVFDVSAHRNVAAALRGLYDSQIAGGKRYDAAAMGREAANATFFASHAGDTATANIFAMDMGELLHNPELDPFDYMQIYLEHFRENIRDRIRKMGG